jgi:hypothetical protein
METLDDIQGKVDKIILSSEQKRASSSLAFDHKQVADRKRRVEESIVKYDKHPFLNGIANPNLTVEEDEATAASLFVSNQSLTK